MKLHKTDRAEAGLHGREAGGNRVPVVLSKILSTDHKNVDTLYFVFAILAGIIGVALSLLVRMEIDGAGIAAFRSFSTAFPKGAATPVYMPAAQVLSFFSSVHALVMIVFMMVPALFCGFGNWLVPLLIGTGDMAFPRLNRAAFWLFVLAFMLFAVALFCLPGNFATAAGLIAALHLAAISAVISAINFIVTIIVMRIPAVRLADMPPFVWSILIAAFFMLLCVPVMTGAVTLLLHAYALQPQEGAFYTLPQLQVMLWFFSHPEIYVLLLPAFGIISHVVATFARSPLYAQKGIAAAMTVIGLAGFVLWTHNLFHDAGTADMQTYFLYSLPVIGLPAAFIVFSWFATIGRRRPDWPTPMLWAAGFMFIFVMGTVSALHLALSHAFSGSPMIFVSHFHYVLSLGAVFAIFAGWYFWFPKMSGFVVRELTGKIHFWVMFIAVNLIFLPQHFQGFAYEPQSLGAAVTAFSSWARLSTIGAVIAAGSLGVFLYGIAEAWIRKKPAGKNLWGEGATTPEWQPASPPPMLPLQQVGPVNRNFNEN